MLDGKDASDNKYLLLLNTLKWKIFCRKYGKERLLKVKILSRTETFLTEEYLSRKKYSCSGKHVSEKKRLEG